MSPNKLSAIILDNLVSSLTYVQQGLDYSLSLKEHSIGSDLSIPSIELGYGISPIQSNNSANLLKILNLGKGLIRTTAQGNLLIPVSLNESGFTIANMLPSDIFNNCYMSGSIFVAIDGGGNPILVSSLLKPKSNPSSSNNFAIFKDISIEEATDMFSMTNSYSASSGYVVSLELFKFIFDIDFYNGNSQSARLNLYMIDNRKTRGVLTFAEEDLAFSFISAFEQNYNLSKRIYDTANSNIKSIINDWINLSSWDPSFVGYWNLPGNTMPTNLKSYINSSLGIIV